MFGNLKTGLDPPKTLVTKLDQRKGAAGMSEDVNRKTTTMEIQWRVEDGYAGGARPQGTEVDDEDILDCETVEEAVAMIEECVQEDFGNKVSPAWDRTSLKLRSRRCSRPRRNDGTTRNSPRRDDGRFSFADLTPDAIDARIADLVNMTCNNCDTVVPDETSGICPECNHAVIPSLVSDDFKASKLWLHRRLDQLGIDVRKSVQHARMRYYIELLEDELRMTREFLEEDQPTV